MKKLLFFLFTALICPSLHAMEEGAEHAARPLKKLKLEDASEEGTSETISIHDILLKFYNLDKQKDFKLSSHNPKLITTIAQLIKPRIVGHQQAPDLLGRTVTLYRLGNYVMQMIKSPLIVSAAIEAAKNKADVDPVLGLRDQKFRLIEMDLSKHGTLLHESIVENLPEITQIILKAGARVDQPNAYGKTPLHLAIEEDRAQVAQVLIKNGADVNRKDHLDTTPLFWAVLNNSLKVAPILIQAGAQVDEETLDRAKEKGNPEMIKLLEEAVKRQSNPQQETMMMELEEKESAHN